MVLSSCLRVAFVCLWYSSNIVTLSHSLASHTDVQGHLLHQHLMLSLPATKPAHVTYIFFKQVTYDLSKDVIYFLSNYAVYVPKGSQIGLVQALKIFGLVYEKKNKKLNNIWLGLKKHHVWFMVQHLKGLGEHRDCPSLWQTGAKDIRHIHHCNLKKNKIKLRHVIIFHSFIFIFIK